MYKNFSVYNTVKERFKTAIITHCDWPSLCCLTGGGLQESPLGFSRIIFFLLSKLCSALFVFLNRWKTHILLRTALLRCIWVTCGRSWNISRKKR